MFARKGRSATMADVAAAAEVSYRPAYRYVANKEAMQDLLKRLIVDDQATGEIVSADPDQLVTAVMDGLTRLAVIDLERFHQHYPDAGVWSGYQEGGVTSAFAR